METSHFIWPPKVTKVVVFFVCEQTKKPAILPILVEILATAAGICPKLWLYEIGKVAQFFASLMGGNFTFYMATKSHHGCGVFCSRANYKACNFCPSSLKSSLQHMELPQSLWLWGNPVVFTDCVEIL